MVHSVAVFVLVCVLCLAGGVPQQDAPVGGADAPQKSAGQEASHESSSPGAKSKEMCKKYGEYVFEEQPDPATSVPHRVDRCVKADTPSTAITEALPREFPHMALVGTGSKDSIYFHCGGSLVSERFVLSSARCTHVHIMRARWVRLGEYKLKSTEDDADGRGQPVDYEIVEWHDHKHFTVDLALYKLERDVVFNQFIRPICLNTEPRAAGSYVTVTGWGNTLQIETVGVLLKNDNYTITTDDHCLTANKYSGVDTSTNMCAEGTWKNNYCQGDFGNPLQTKLTEPYCMYSLIGVTSKGIKSCGAQRPPIFMKVLPFLDWIESKVWP